MLSGLRNCGVDLAGYGGFGLMLTRISTIGDLLTYQISNSSAPSPSRASAWAFIHTFVTHPRNSKIVRISPMFEFYHLARQ